MTRWARPLATALPIAMILGAVGVTRQTLHARREAWWDRTEALCACGEGTRRALRDLQRASAGGLPEVIGLELQALQANCDDLREAMDRRTWRDELSRRPLTVRPTERHRATARELSSAIGRLCGEAHRAFWEELTARTEAPDPDATTAALLPALRELVRVRGATCQRREALTALRTYALTAREADEAARSCEAPRR